MPIYDHKCECGETLSEFRRAARWNVLPTCPKCGLLMPQVFGRQAVRASYKKPVELQSMGFIADPIDVAEHRARFPNVDLVMREGSAIPVMRSLGQKRAYLKAVGWADTRSY
jgi:putative FmdB family regulatory protein